MFNYPLPSIWCRKPNMSTGISRFVSEQIQAPHLGKTTGNLHQSTGPYLCELVYQCLLPLANTPLIEYTFEFLALAGVEDVYVFCSAHSDQIDEYIRYFISFPASTLLAGANTTLVIRNGALPTLPSRSCRQLCPRIARQSAMQ